MHCSGKQGVSEQIEHDTCLYLKVTSYIITNSFSFESISNLFLLCDLSFLLCDLSIIIRNAHWCALCLLLQIIMLFCGWQWHVELDPGRQGDPLVCMDGTCSKPNHRIGFKQSVDSSLKLFAEHGSTPRTGAQVMVVPSWHSWVGGGGVN